MKTSTKIIAAATAALALGAGGLVFAQAGQGPYGRMGGGMGMQAGMGMQQHGIGMGMNGGGRGGMAGGMHDDMRGAGAMGDPTTQLPTVKAELKITAAQESAWQAFEGVVREQAASRQAIRTAMQAQMQAQAQARQQDPNAATTFDHAAQRESMLKARESHRATLDTARQALFAVLTPEQKALAEQRMPGGPDAGRGARMHRHAG